MSLTIIRLLVANVYAMTQVKELTVRLHAARYMIYSHSHSTYANLRTPNTCNDDQFVLCTLEITGSGFDRCR